MNTTEHDHQPSESTLRPVPFGDGHALTFTLREVYDAGEFLSQYQDRAAAFHAFALARKHARYAELRDARGNVIAEYARRRRAPRYMHRSVKGSAS